jgi:DNA-directed RNA polymerase specialized sigma24 family protein
VDAEAERFSQFVEARQRALQRTAWLLADDWALAEDLAQTALVQSWPRWERIRWRDDPDPSGTAPTDPPADRAAFGKFLTGIRLRW